MAGLTADDARLLDRLQAETLRHFRDLAHPVSAMARERTAGAVDYDVAETVTTGGTGFGVMALIAGAERGFLPMGEAVERIATICGFLETADRFRGAFPHWMGGRTGRTIAFSPNDDGGDVVETAFLMMGLITARQWLADRDPRLAGRLDALWRGVDWAGYCRTPTQLMWHWSPGHDWAQDLLVTGWHEGLVAYVLAAGSPAHPIDPAAYVRGWQSGAWFRNGQVAHGIRLPLGPPMGGPLFFAHYSFLGLDPRGLRDGAADYWVQNCAHVRINHAHCLANPQGRRGYGPAWGLTACDGDRGYDAFSPTNDRGVIAPTAALASMPYAPDLALAAMRHYDRLMDGALWGPAGFYDAFNETAGWVAPGHLAIDQGSLVAMVENARSGLLWRLFMSAPEVAAGLDRLGFAPRPRGTPAAPLA
ncbi:MAG: beta-glucosidase [Rhodobacterales bacterium]|nr:beta-glucosidase [Rhodobacterales bacterium]